MRLDAELELWRAEWQASSEAPALSDLPKRVARQSRYIRIMLAADILVTAVIGGGTIALAARSPRAATLLLAVATWLFITAAWIFALSNRRNAWSPSASTTSAYLEVSLRRCRASLRAVTFGAVLYVVEMAFCLTWVFHELSVPLSTFFTSATLILVYLFTVLLAAGLFWYRKKKQADLAYLLNLQREPQPSE
jgi:hypothetical protein